MKWFLISCAFCLVTVSAAPDLFPKLVDPKAIAAAIGNALTTTLAPAEVGTSTSTPDIETTTPTEADEWAAEHNSDQGTVTDRTKLLKDLFTGYDKRVNPDDVTLKFGINLMDFKVCEKRNVLDSYVWLRYVWKDQRLAWDPKEYGGAAVIRLNSNEVWKPDVTLYNSADPVNMINCWNSNVLVYATGKLLWVPPCKMTSQCSMDLAIHPYGEQNCSYKFGSWTYDGNIVDLQLYNMTNAFDTSHIKNTSGFDIVSTSAERHEKYYPCCKEPYPNVTFNMTIKRVPGDELFKRM